MWKESPPFSFSAGERKIMAHFVVKTVFWLRLAALCDSRFHRERRSYLSRDFYLIVKVTLSVASSSVM